MINFVSAICLLLLGTDAAPIGALTPFFKEGREIIFLTLNFLTQIFLYFLPFSTDFFLNFLTLIFLSQVF